MRANVDTSAVLATDHDEGAVFLYTGRRSVPVTTFTAAEYFAARDSSVDAGVLRALAAHYEARYLLLSSPRLRGAATAMVAAGMPLGDGTHKVVPWAFALPAR